MMTLFLAVGALTVWRQAQRPARRNNGAPARDLRPLSGRAQAPRGVFDPIYAGLSADAGHLDRALERHNALR
jgi:hypothetical protein